MPDRDEQPDVVGRLLEGRTGFSSDERHAMFEDVFASVEAEAEAEAPAGQRSWWAGILALTAAAAAVAVALVVSQPDPADEFRARGKDTNLELRCTGAGGCAAGDALVFELSGAQKSYFAAFARDESGTVIWYFPEDATGRSIAVEGPVIERSIRLGDELRAGAWTVYAVLSATPLSRGDIRSCFAASGGFECPDHELLLRELTIR